MKTALVFPPQWFPSQPYLALPTLKGYLQEKGHVVDQYDFNIESYDLFLSEKYLRQCVEKIRGRLSLPAYSLQDKEVKEVYRQILSDTDYLDSIFENIEDAKNVLRDEVRFFQFPVYKKAYTHLKVAMKLISYAHFPSRIDLESFFMEGSPEDSVKGIVQATNDSVSNPYKGLYENEILKNVDWESYGVAGISIIHVGQVIPGLTLARLLKERYPNLHIVIGGSVFTRHTDVIQSKAILFERFFDSIILFEGEKPLETLVTSVKEGKPLREVPNLVHLENGKVVRNDSCQSLPYDQLVRPDFDQLALDKYLMPYPVLPYMSSRGCYWGKCTFCTHSHVYDSYYRKENEERVAEDLDYLGKRYKTRYFTFSDEAISPSAFRRVSTAILSRGVPMRALGMLKFESNNIENAELFEQMYRAGFIMLFFGLESANDRILSVIDKGTDQATEQRVLNDSARAGIWNHTYLFFGFPTETRSEAEETIEFVVHNSETGNGSICSVGQSIFTLEKDSAIFHNPGRFSVDQILHNPERDMAIMFDFDIKKGMSREEVNDVYQEFEQVIDENFPSGKIWKYLSREHFLLYLDRFGKDGILQMADNQELTEAVES